MIASRIKLKLIYSSVHDLSEERRDGGMNRDHLPQFSLHLDTEKGFSSEDHKICLRCAYLPDPLFNATRKLNEKQAVAGSSILWYRISSFVKDFYAGISHIYEY